MNDEKNIFEIHALVELFGHQRIAGKVSEQVIAGTGFVRVDVPETAKRAGYTRFFNPSAVYGITPVDEEAARRLAESIYAPDIIPITSSARRLTDGEGPEDYDA